MAKRRLNVFAEGVAGPKQQGFDGGYGGAEHGRDLLVAQLLLVAQGEGHLLLVWQPGNVGQQQLELLLAFQQGQRVGVVGGLVQYAIVETQQAGEIGKALWAWARRRFRRAREVARR